MTKIIDKHGKEICSLYKDGKNAYEIADLFNISHTTIYDILNEYDIDTRSKKVARRTESLNDNAFSEITEESAYWIGFLMADGSVISKVKKSSPTIYLRLKRSDKEHIKKFKDFVGSSHSIQDLELKEGMVTGKFSGISFNSEQMANDLAKYGVIPNKTYNSSVKKVQNNPHFWRGMIDGDGYISISNKNRARIGLAGNKENMDKFKMYTKSIVNHSNNLQNKSGNKFIFELHGKNSIPIINSLYKNASVYLERKYKIFKKMERELF